MLTLLLLAMLGVPADVLTVDNAGGAQFTSIQAAIDAAAPGDVIEVNSGHYPAFTLGKDLTIVGPADGLHPHVSGTSTLSAADFRIAGLDCVRVMVTGAGSLVDCNLGGVPGMGGTALDVEGSSGLLVSHCTLHGEDEAGSMAALVSASLASFTSCTITGGKGFDAFNDHGGDAGAALKVQSGSHVTIAECLLHGGKAGLGNQFLNPDDGKPGDGLWVTQSQVVVRGGTSFAELLSGFTSDPNGPFAAGLDLDHGTVSVSNTFVDKSVKTSGSTLLLAPSPEPLLDLQGGASVDQMVELRLFGPAGAPALLLASASSGFTQVPALEAPLWLPLGDVLLPLVATGFASPLDVQAHLPNVAGLEGTSIRVQAAFPGLHSTLSPTKVLVSNPVAAIVRF